MLLIFPMMTKKKIERPQKTLKTSPAPVIAHVLVDCYACEKECPRAAALEAENFKLQKKIVKLKAEIISLTNEIKAWVEKDKENKENSLAKIMAGVAEQMKKAKIKG